MAELLRLLVIDDASNHTEALSSMLRNAGYAVRAKRAEDEEDLLNELNQASSDLVIATPDNSDFKAIDVLSILLKHQNDIPLIILSDNEESEQTSKLLDAGAKDVISLEKPQNAIHTILREVEVSKIREELSNYSLMLQEANTRAQSLVDSAHDAITYVHEGMYIYANEAYLEMFGYKTLEDIEGMPIMSMVEKEDQPKLKKFLRGYSKSSIAIATQDVTGVKADGSKFNITMEFAPASYENERCTQIIIQVQAQNEELVRQLDDLSKIDQLTGVYNRRFLFDNLEKLCGIKKRYGAFFCITPDNLKNIRENHGIEASDTALKTLAKHLEKSLSGKNDFIARFEGGKFGIVINGFELEQAEAFAQTLLSSTEELILDLGKESTSTTLSIGIALFNETLSEHHEVITRAERANFEVISNKGGNGFLSYIPSAEEMQSQERVSVLAREIKNAIRENALILFFQPMISLKDDPHENYQILLRMPSNDDNHMPSEDFFNAATESGLMIAVDRWVIAHAIKTLMEKRKTGSLTRFFVKLSADSIKDPAKFLPWLRDVVKLARLEPGVLTLEVDDAVARNQLKNLKLVVQGLKKLQIRLCLNHFGKEVNYANVLKHIDATYLKLDETLVHKLADDQQTLNKIRDITTLAASERRQVIAHAVESPHTLAVIYSTGIDYIQGYFLQEPRAVMDYDFS